MKKILLIGTGGTIASQVTEDGLAPELTSAQLFGPYTRLFPVSVTLKACSF